MNTKLGRMMKDERGITALETAIILIAFVVVAAIFAFTVLSTGTFLTERSKEAAYAGLQEVRGSMELKGSIIAHSATLPNVDYLTFALSTVAGGSSVDLNTGATTAKVRFTYRDSTTNTDLNPLGGNSAGAGYWLVTTCTNCTGSSGSYILPTGGLAVIQAWVPSGVTLTSNNTFAVEIKPPTGGTMLLERTLPAQIDTFTDLH